MEKEYASLRDEIMKWQDRRIAFTQTGITLVTAYTGFMLSLTIPLNGEKLLSWQVASLLPLLITAVLLNVARIFELFQLRAAAFLAVFHNSPWENHVTQAPFQLIWRWRPSYNKTTAILYVSIPIASTIILAIKYPNGNLFHWILFIVFAGVCAFSFWMMLTFKSRHEKQVFIDYWKGVHEAMPKEDKGAGDTADT